MVWFQCEDCGEDLKKPKLPNHFRICSAHKLSCIDCGETFGQQTVLGHTQCMTEAEKYGPKGQGKTSNGTPAKTNNGSKKNQDVDINVGLSLRPPWFCSLCNTNATSKQTLLLHADGKKHRAKARAFHASKQQSNEKDESTPSTKELTEGPPKGDSVCNAGVVPSKQDRTESTPMHAEAEIGSIPIEKKRKLVDSDDGSSKKKEVSKKGSVDVSNGEVIQAKRVKTVEPESLNKKTKHQGSPDEKNLNLNGDTKEAKNKKIKWKKLITSILRSNPDDGGLKLRKLQKLVIKSVQESGHSEDVDQIKEKLMEKINSSSRFTIDNKLVRLVTKG